MKETDPAIRTPDQNARLRCRLRDLSRQLKWPVNGCLIYMSEEDWKDVLTAGLTKHQRLAAGIEGGWVMLGERTSKMKKPEMALLLDYIDAFGATREPQIVWSDPTVPPDDSYEAAGD